MKSMSRCRSPWWKRAEREEHVTVRKQVVETADREETIVVQKPVYETAEREDTIVVQKPSMKRLFKNNTRPNMCRPPSRSRYVVAAACWASRL